MSDNPYESSNATARVTKADDPILTNRRAVVVALLQQVFVVMIAALVLDGGILLRKVSVALAVSWLVTLAVLLRYRSNPTRISTVFVAYGFWISIGFVVLSYFVG